MGSFNVLVNHHFGHEETIHDHEQAFQSSLDCIVV